MLNQVKFTIASEKEDETKYYGREDLSSLKVERIVHPEYPNTYPSLKKVTDTENDIVYFCYKGDKDYFGRQWYAYLDLSMSKEFKVTEAYTFRNLKGMLL